MNQRLFTGVTRTDNGAVYRLKLRVHNRDKCRWKDGTASCLVHYFNNSICQWQEL